MVVIPKVTIDNPKGLERGSCCLPRQQENGEHPYPAGQILFSHRELPSSHSPQPHPWVAWQGGGLRGAGQRVEGVRG